MREFKNREDCREYLVNSFASEGLEANAAAELADKMVAWHPSSIPSIPGYGLILHQYRYVIRDDDLKLLDAFRDGFLALASVNFFLSSATASAVAGLGFATIRLVRAVWKKGAVISDAQFQLLSFLKAHDARITTKEIVEALNLIPRSTPWTIDDIEFELKRLSNIVLNDGSIVPLVAKDNENRWGVVDV